MMNVSSNNCMASCCLASSNRNISDKASVYCLRLCVFMLLWLLLLFLKFLEHQIKLCFISLDFIRMDGCKKQLKFFLVLFLFQKYFTEVFFFPYSPTACTPPQAIPSPNILSRMGCLEVVFWLSAMDVSGKSHKNQTKPTFSRNSSMSQNFCFMSNSFFTFSVFHKVDIHKMVVNVYLFLRVSQHRDTKEKITFCQMRRKNVFKML